MRGRELRYIQSDTALYAIVLGNVEQSFTIEQPDIHSSSIEVLGAEVIHTQDRDGRLTLTLNKSLNSPAAVVRFNRPQRINPSMLCVC
jgi:hypothetical protein